MKRLKNIVDFRKSKIFETRGINVHAHQLAKAIKKELHTGKTEYMFSPFDKPIKVIVSIEPKLYNLAGIDFDNTGKLFLKDIDVPEYVIAHELNHLVELVGRHGKSEDLYYSKIANLISELEYESRGMKTGTALTALQFTELMLMSTDAEINALVQETYTKHIKQSITKEDIEKSIAWSNAEQMISADIDDNVWNFICKLSDFKSNEKSKYVNNIQRAGHKLKKKLTKLIDLVLKETKAIMEWDAFTEYAESPEIFKLKTNLEILSNTGIFEV